MVLLYCRDAVAMYVMDVTPKRNQLIVSSQLYSIFNYNFLFSRLQLIIVLTINRR